LLLPFESFAVATGDGKIDVVAAYEAPILFLEKTTLL